MASLIDLLTQVTVKIHCQDNDDEKDGSGSLVSDGDRFFILTAGHCVKKDSNEQPFNPEDIEITTYAGERPDQILVVEPIKWYDFSEEKDYAVLVVSEPQVTINLVERVKRCDTQLDEETYHFYGYTQHNEQGRLYTIRRTGKNQWHLCDDSITNQILGAYDIMGGNSGAGVFFIKTGVLYHVGYVKRMIDEVGTQSDLIIYPTCYFDNFLPECTKESNLFDLVKRWSELNQKDINEELMQEYKDNNQEYLTNLSRKMHVLYPKDSEASEKEKMHLNNYLHGLELNAEISKSSHVARILREREASVFQAFCDDRSKYVEDKDARNDMGIIKKQITELADSVLDIHDKDKAVAQGYAEYSIAEKLLDCSLDYRKINDDK